MTLKKEVYVEKRGYEGKHRAEVEIREKNVQGGGGAGPRGVQNHSFYGSTRGRRWFIMWEMDDGRVASIQ